jgi:type IV pilus assembly protein PilZ
MVEHRIHPRADQSLGVQYRSVPEFVIASSMNISRGGMYVCTPQPLPRNREIQLRLTFPGVAHPLQISGVVIWSNPGTIRSPFPPGMGIKFLDLTETDAKLIADFIAKAKGRGEPPAPTPAPAPPTPVTVGADDLGITMAAAPAEPALAVRVPPTAKLSDSVQITVLPEDPAATPAAPLPSAPESMIPEHIRRQMEHMLSLQAPPSAPEPVRPAPPASGPVPPPTPAEKPGTTQPGQPGQSSQKPRPPQKPEEKKKT